MSDAVSVIDPRAARAEKYRDLSRQIDGLSDEEEGEIQFRDTSPKRRRVPIYSAETGEPILVLAYRLRAIMDKRLPDGRPAFVADPADAPKYKRGTVKCFLHPESPERLSGLLEEAGIASHTCMSGNLASKYAMEEVARSKHKKQWAALQSYLDTVREDEYREMQKKQLEATLELARGAAGQVLEKQETDTNATSEVFQCPEEGCKYSGTRRQLQGHRMGSHK